MGKNFSTAPCARTTSKTHFHNLTEIYQRERNKTTSFPVFCCHCQVHPDTKHEHLFLFLLSQQTYAYIIFDVKNILMICNS